MTKLLVTTLMFLLLSGCGARSQHQENSVVTSEDKTRINSKVEKTALLTIEIKARLDKAIKQAKKENDTRLFATKGRRVVIVGIDPEKFEYVKKMCGIKFLSGSNDVLKNEQDKAVRRSNYTFAQNYNKAIYKKCLLVKSSFQLL